MTYDDVLAFVERCAEIRDGSPNAFYAHVDMFCRHVRDERASNNRDDDEATAELLSALDALYPLPDDVMRVERAGRTAFIVKRWVLRQMHYLERCVPQIVAAAQLKQKADRNRHLKVIAEMTQLQACSLWRFGKSGHPYLGGDDVLTAAFQARFKELGGFTPEISKSLGF